MALLAAGCSGGGTIDGFCGRWDDLLDDMSDGKVETEDEFLDRIAPDNLGAPADKGTKGARLARLRQNLEDAVRSGTTAEAFEWTNQISFNCFG